MAGLVGGLGFFAGWKVQSQRWAEEHGVRHWRPSGKVKERRSARFWVVIEDVEVFLWRMV